jgi:hypothetical protein
LDSGEPFCTSHTVRKMYRKNCRYSDCQFSATSTPKLAEVTYRPQETRGRPSAICCWLKSAWPAIDWPTSTSRNRVPKTRLIELSRRNLFTGGAPPAR